MTDVKNMTAEELMEACLAEFCRDGEHWKSAPFQEYLACLRERDAAKSEAKQIGFASDEGPGEYYRGRQDAASEILAAMHAAREKKEGER